MHLSCKTLFIVAIASTLACHDAAAPPTPPVGYWLHDINGRPVPTYLSPIPEAPTIISATLLLAASGDAKLIEHRQQMAGGDVTDTTNYTYKITGNEIQFDYNPPCPANAICTGPPKGTITGSQLTLEINGIYSGILYNFQLFAQD